MANPVLSKNENFTSPLSTQTADEVDDGLFTVDGAVHRSVLLLGGTALAAAVGWFILPVALAVPAAIIAFVVGLIAGFRREPSVPLYATYAAVSGASIGVMSRLLEGLYPGVVFQALLATASVFAVVFFLFRSGKIRASARATKIFVLAAVSYLLFSLTNFALTIFGVLDAPFGLRSAEIFGIPFGVPLGILVVILASYSLVLDFDFIQTASRKATPRKFEWMAAFGITVTVVWLYIEILRLFSILRGDD